jgi:hypothetical protein
MSGAPSRSTASDPDQETRRLFRAWLGFAAVVLSLAAFFVLPAALEAALGGADILGSPAVRRYLVGHVFFSMVLGCTAFLVILWMLSILWVQASRFPTRAGWSGFGISVAGGALAAISIIVLDGEPELTDLVPIVVEPVFLAGFALFLLGISVTTICFIYAVTSVDVGRMPLIPFGMLTTALVILAAGLAGLASVARLFGDWFAFRLAWRTPYALAQALLWGPGHLVPYALVGGMVVAWLLMIPAPGLGRWEERLARAGFIGLVGLAAIVLLVLFAVNPLALPTMNGLNLTIRGSLMLPAVVLCWLVVKAAFRATAWAWYPGFPLSLALFLVGLIMVPVGLLLLDAKEGRTAWVPAHYVAVIVGAVLLAFTQIVVQVIPLWDKGMISQPLAEITGYLYGGGVLLVSLAMFWGACSGGERHGYFVTIPGKLPTALLWFGGLAAELGVFAFAANIFGALFQRETRPRNTSQPMKN